MLIYLFFKFLIFNLNFFLNLLPTSGKKGCVIYEMLHGLPPFFYANDQREMFFNILNKPVKLRTNISNAAKDIIVGVSVFIEFATNCFNFLLSLNFLIVLYHF